MNQETKVNYQALFIGVIFDRCQFYAVKRVKAFRFSIQGTLAPGMSAKEMPLTGPTPVGTHRDFDRSASR